MAEPTLQAREPAARYLAAVQPAMLRQFELLATAPGGVARLRDLILTLAVQGRLVPQDRSDEPASVFVEPIRLRRAGEPTGGRARNQTPGLESTEEDVPFDLPIGWQQARLGSIFTLQYGAALPEKTRLAGSIPVYGSNGQVGTHCEALVQEPSLVIGRKGSVGAVNVTSGPFWPIDTSYFVTPPDGVHLQFAYWLFRSLRLGKHDKATAIPGISRNDVYAELIALPPTAEQARIVARVDELMRLCDALEAKGRLEAEQHARLLGTLLGTLTDSSTPEELATNWQRVADHFDLLLDRPDAMDALEQTVLQLAVRGLLVPQDPSDEPATALLQRVRLARENCNLPGRAKRGGSATSQAMLTEPFTLPAGWMWSTLPDLCAITGGSTPSKAVAGNWIGDIPWVSPKDMKVSVIEDAQDHVSSAALAGSLSLIQPGSLLMVVRGMILAHSFPVAVTRVPVTINQDMKAFTPFEPRLLPFLMLLCEGMKTEVLALVDRSTHGTCKLESPKIFGLRIPLPSLAEQARIVARVTELRRLCADLRQRLTASQTTQSHLAEALVDSAAA